MKKNKKMVIAIIVFIVLILIIGVALAFVLKTNNKEEFFKYAEQLFENENGFVDERLNQLDSKKASKTYENKGKITINISSDDKDKKTLDQINNDFSISFAGNTDNLNDMSEELIKINYSKNENFPILYKKVGDLQAIKLNKIMQKYIAVEADETDSILSNLGLNINVPDVQNIGLTTGEKEKIKNEYLSIVKDNLEESNFSKVSTSEETGYSVKISGEKLKQILINILEKLEQDDEILDKLNISANNIEEIKQNIEAAQYSDVTTITLYTREEKLNRVLIDLNNQAKIEISKTNMGNELEYKISITANIDGEDYIASLTAYYTGLQNLETITANYTIDLEVAESKYSYAINSEINFVDVDIKDFEENECVNINELSSSNIARLFQLIGEKFVDVNNKLMSEAGINSEKFLQSLVPTVTTTNTDYYDDYYDDEIDEDEDEEEDESLTEQENTVTKKKNAENEGENTQSDLAASFTETEKNVFNSKYEAYEGERIRGSNVKQLIMNIIANNMADEDRQIKVTGDFTLTGNEVPEGIETSKVYKVELDYSADGYVNKVEITENE